MEALLAPGEHGVGREPEIGLGNWLKMRPKRTVGICDPGFSTVIRFKAGWGSVRFTPVVNAKDADQIRRFAAKKDSPLADP